jgi:hypothetical protein
MFLNKKKMNKLNHHRPYWKELHHSLIFWVFLLLMFAGITYYIVSVDFAFAPQRQLKPASKKSLTL